MLTESEKFGRRGVVPLNLPRVPQLVVTNGNIPPEALAALEEQGVEPLLTD